MIVHVDPTGTVEGFQTIVDQIKGDENIKGLLILASEKNGFKPDNIDNTLKHIPVPLFGGIFPALISGCEKLDIGTIVVCMDKKPQIFTVPGLSHKNMDLDTAIENIIPESDDAKTMFVFMDGYSQRISALVDCIYNIFGYRYNFIGGGAGSINPSVLDMKTSPCLFTNQGLIEDSALLALVDYKSGVGVEHGWKKISGPYKVTESSGNAIKSLDWRPAFDVYKQIINRHSGKTINHDNFFDIAKQFPFGINRFGSEIIVRDPFTADGESLIVATEIPQESFVDVLTGDPESLIRAAKKSCTEARNSFRGEQPKSIFMIDCISRVLFLGKKFSKELEAVWQKNLPLVGVLSLGEIANSGKDFMELYNKTCVVSVLGD